MLKKICSVILILCMSLSTTCALAYDDVETAKQRMAAELVTGLEIMSSDNENSFGSKTLVKRGEFALYAARLMGYPISTNSTSKGYFEDVDTTTPEGAAVDFLAALNVIPKNKMEYNPNDEVTYAEAVRILLNCMGYSEIAKLNGGYPGGYIKTATDYNLNKNVWMMTNSVLTKADAAVLLYNAMLMKPMEYMNREYKFGDKTILEKVFDLHEVTGVVMGCGSTYIGDNKQLNDNDVEINGIVCDIGNTSIAQYIGYSVKAYYREDDDGTTTLVAFTEKQDANTVTTIDIDDLEEVSDGRISYNADKSKKNLKISNSVSVIYNGRYYANYTNIEDLLSFAEGQVTFIANNSQNSVNVIIIKEHKHLLVERVDARNDRLYLKNSSPTEDTVPYLAYAETISQDDADVRVFLDGKEVSFEDIKSNDAVTMEKSLDGEDITLYISRTAVNGKITSVSEDEIGIDGHEYTLSKYCTTSYPIGTMGNFAITADGKFLGLITTQGNSNNNYAYVLNVYTDDGPEEASVKLYTGKGEVVKYKCITNININGKKREYNEVKNYLSKSDFVTYTVNNDGLLSKINRPYDASSNLDYVNETDFVKNWNKSSVRYTDGIMGMSFVTDDTVIFSMPRFDRNNNSDYRLLNKSDLKNRTYADVTCYDVDSQGRIGALLIVEDISDSVSMGNSLFFVNKKYDRVNDDNDIIRVIEGYEDGEEKTLTFTDDTTSITYEDGWMNYVGNEDFDTGYANLNTGDAIQYILDNDGNVSAYRLVYNNYKTIHSADGELTYNDSSNYFEDWSGTGSVTKQDFYDDLYIAYGDVQMRYMDYMVMLGLNQEDRLGYESSSSPIQIIDYYRPFNLLKSSVYVYNVRRDKLEIGDMEDVLKGDTVFVRSKKMGEKNEIMVYVEN